MILKNIVLGLILIVLTNHTTAQQTLPVDEVQAIAKEAYVYGFPILENYRIMHAYFVNANSAEYKAPFNQIKNINTVYTPQNRAVPTPNIDLLFSFLGADLRTEPIVITLPSIEKNRYYSVQLIDLYTHNFDYFGSRTTGNDGGNFLVAGPNWKGTPPPGIKKVARAETELVMLGFRTQLFNLQDVENVNKIQSGFKAQPLSSFLGQPAPAQAAAISFPEPLTADEEKTSLGFFRILNFLLQFCPPHPSETYVRGLFSKIGIEAGKPFQPDSLSAEMQAAMKGGMEDGQKQIDAARARLKSGSDLFGSRESLRNNYIFRALGAQTGIYGNSKEEAFYFGYQKDANSVVLNGAENNYVLRFNLGEIPPVNGFWSITMYELPDSLLAANLLNRYSINSAMMDSLKTDADGSLAIYVQDESPGPDKESNWLPAPKGPFFMVLRAYNPKSEIPDRTWKAPPLQRAN
jgi:hypothetical protein